MNKLTLTFLATMIFAIGVMSAEYRTFTNQEGKPIVARVLNYEAQSSKVELELKNNKKAWIELSTLSEDDQAYIKKLYQKENENGSEVIETVTHISEAEVEALAKLYIKAVEEHDEQLWRSLLTPQQRDRTRSGRFYPNPMPQKIKKIRLKGIDGLNVKIGLRRHSISGFRAAGWLQFTPTGQIKYTPFGRLQHPFMHLMREYESLYEEEHEDLDGTYVDNVALRVGAYETLKTHNIPMFGYNPKASVSKRRSSAKEIGAWMKTNMTQWDDSEPKLPIPEEHFEELFEHSRKNGML